MDLHDCELELSLLTFVKADSGSWISLIDEKLRGDIQEGQQRSEICYSMLVSHS